MKKFYKDENTEVSEKSQNPNTPEESKFLNYIIKNQQNAESVRGTDYNDSESTILSNGIEQVWEDEYKIFIGDQWDTSFAYRSKSSRKTRPNSVDNFVFSAVMNATDNIEVNTPEVVIEGQEENDNDVAEKLTYLSKYNDSIHRNNFKALWRKMVQQFISYGPVIGAVLWDNEWIGGRGPNRWVGDVRVLNIDRRHIYFDPAIIDLEDRLQECEFIHRKFRKKLSYIKEKFPSKGKYVSEDTNDMELQDEGMDPKQVWLIESWHKCKPKFVPDKYKKEFMQKAAESEANGDYYKAQDYKDMASGKLKGIHCAYVANNVFLDYVPYVYEDGLYPFIYKVLYFDENTPYGFGEIRNIKIPQVMHNKADEIELEAMSREGLGGMYHKEGAVSPKQKEQIMKYNGKGGMWLEVNDVNGLKEREGAKVPASVREYKEHKQRMVETISANTPIQQGMSPGANVPYRAIAELGARVDVRTKAKVEILEDFLTEMNKLRINRFVQFYTEDRYYRLKGNNGETIFGTFNNQMMFQEWEREDGKFEMFVPEFDVSVKIMDEKPTDRNYYTSTAFELVGMGAMTIPQLWYTLEEGKFPPKDQILEELQSRDMAMQLTEMLKQVPPEMQQQFMQLIGQQVQQIAATSQGQEQMQPQPQGQDIDMFLDSLPDEELAMLQQMPEEEQQAYIQQLMSQAPQ